MSKRTRKLRQPFETAAFRLALAVIPRLPRRAILALACLAGALGPELDWRGRRTGLANLDLAFGATKTARQKRRILRGAYRTMALTFLDVIWFGRDSAGRLDRYVSLDASAEQLLCSRRQIFVTAHFGNWEAAGQLMARRGFPLHSIAMPVKNSRVNQLLIERREITGQRIIPREGALRRLIGLLRADCKVAFLADQNTAPNEGGTWALFFGLSVPVTAAPAALAVKTGTEILTGFCAPCAGGHYRIYGTGRIDPSDTGGGDPAQEITQKIQAALESEIRRSPEHWLWMYKRWKLIPAGEQPQRFPFYARPVDA